MKNVILAILLLFSFQLFAIDSTYVAFAGSVEANGYYAAIDTVYVWGVACPVFSNGVCEITKDLDEPGGKYEGNWWELTDDGNQFLYGAQIGENNDYEVPAIDDWDTRSGIDPVPVCYFGEYLQYSYLIFNETSTESGEFDDTDPMIIRHNNFKNRAFTGFNGEDFYASGKVSISNIPSGITPEVIRIDSSTLHITLVGTAVSHRNTNDAYLPISFHNSAFTSSDSSAVYFGERSCKINFKQEIHVAPSGGDYSSLGEAYIDGHIGWGGGDIIYVAPGVYDETLMLVRKDIDIIGSGVDNTIVQYDLGASYTDYIFEILRGNVNISGMHLRYGSITSTENDGGAINIDREAIVNLDNVLITESKGGHGGAIYNYGILNIKNSTIKNCEATSSGGAIYAEYNSETNIENTTISGNTAISYDGGAIYSNGSGSINNSTIAFNSTGRNGGGICARSYSDISIVNSTIYGNTSTDIGGGLWNNWSDMSIINTIIAGNYADSIPNDYHVTHGLTLTDHGYNCIGSQSFEGTPDNWYFTEPTNILYNMKSDSTSSSEWTRSNIALVNQTLGLDSVLADNYTKNGTQTIAVLNGSFLVDAGTDQDVGELIILELDQRGWDRYGMVDIGAYEHGTASVPRNANAVSNGSEVTVTWDSVEGATSYIIYASVKPYSDFQDLSSYGTFNSDTEWTVPYAGQKMFFYVVSSPSDRKSTPIGNVTDEMILEYLTK